ncbi:unnamed protein product [Symbiodinium sp. KB8]|nr:unnamed protein product [Symbiodinium sp. KB8]
MLPGARDVGSPEIRLASCHDHVFFFLRAAPVNGAADAQVQVPVRQGRVLLQETVALPYVPWFQHFQGWCTTLRTEEASLAEEECLHPRNAWSPIGCPHMDEFVALLLFYGGQTGSDAGVLPRIVSEQLPDRDKSVASQAVDRHLVQQIISSMAEEFGSSYRCRAATEYNDCKYLQVLFDAGSPAGAKALFVSLFAPELGVAAVLPHQARGSAV